jgi:crotonobetainyl-CoA:carnitine CoA-transferase CaiB-like acyl-CoA transferase
VCVAAVDARQRQALTEVLGAPAADDVEFDAFEPAFATRSARDWVEALDTAGVPAEVSDPEFVMSLFDDLAMIERGWVATYDHPVVGRMDAFGLLFDFSETPGVVQGPPFLAGQHSREILAETGRDDDAIAALLASGAILALD